MDLPLLITPKRHADSRGWFCETYHEQKLREYGVTCAFVQDNQSSSVRRGTLRGLHFQRPPAAQAKLVSVLRGRILDVVVDIRKASPTYGKHISVELSAESGNQFYVPEGFAHGFLTLEDDVLVMYKVSRHYSAQHDAGIRWNDPDIAFPWPVPTSEVVTSDKDGRLPMLRDFDSPFTYSGNPLRPIENLVPVI